MRRVTVILGFLLAAMACSRLGAEPPKADLYGDLLPEGAVARLGTVRFRHLDRIKHVAFSPDGRLLVSLGDDKVRLWDAQSGKPLREFIGGSSASVTADLKTVAMADSDNTIHVWDMATGAELRTIRRGWEGEHQLHTSLSPNGKLLVSEDMLYETATGKAIRKLPNHFGGFSPDSTSLLTWEFYKPAIVQWDATTGKKLRTLQGFEDGTHSYAFSLDGSRLALGAQNGPLEILDLATGKRLARWPAHNQTVNSVAFSPDGKMLASGGNDTMVYLWDAATGRMLHRLDRHRGIVTSVAFSPDGKLLASGSWDQSIQLWNTATGRLVTAAPAHATSWIALAFSPDGKNLLTGGWDHSANLWESRTGKQVFQLKGHDKEIVAVAFSTDGRLLATRGWDDTIRLWDAATGKGTAIETFGLGHGLAFSPDSKLIAGEARNATEDTYAVELWDTSTRKTARSIPVGRDHLTSIAFSPDGKLLASASYLASGGPATSGPSVRVWEVATGKELSTPEGQRGYAEAVAFSPNGKLLAGGMASGTIRLWEVSTGTEIRAIIGPDYQARCVAWTPDCTVLVSTGIGHSIHFWDVSSGKMLRKWTSPKHLVKSIAVSADGKWLASTASDTTVLVWDMEACKNAWQK